MFFDSHRKLAVMTLFVSMSALAGTDTPVTTLTLDTAGAAFKVGEATDVHVRVQGAPPVAGIQMVIGYDAASLRIVDTDAKTAGVQAAHGTFFNAGKDFFTVRNDADAKTGEITYVASALFPATQSQGDGELLTFRVAPMKPGDATLVIRSARFGDFDGKSHEAALGEPLVASVLPSDATPLGIQMPAVAPAPQPEALRWAWIAGGIGGLLILAGAFLMGRRSRATR